MEKAYDLKVLKDRLVAKGVPFMDEAAEEGVKVILKEVFPWLTESAKLSDTAYDDFLATFYPQIEAYITSMAENINPADNK